MKVFVDKEVGDRKITTTVWSASHQSGFSGFQAFTPRGTRFEDFNTSDIRKWERYDVQNSSNSRSIPLKFKDLSQTADATVDGSQLGVGYSYASWIHPLVLAEEYSAYLLCYHWDDDQLEADTFYHNIPPAKVELGPNGMVANFMIPGDLSINRCLVEISSNLKPETVVFRKEGLHLVNGVLSINDRLEYHEPQPHFKTVRDIELSGPSRSVDLDTTQIDQIAAAARQHYQARERIKSQCEADPESLVCKQAGTMLLRRLGTDGSGLSVDYHNRCKSEGGSEIVNDCFVDEKTPSTAALNPYFDGSKCSSDSQVDCTFDFQIFKDEYLGPDIDPITLYEMKNIKVTYYKDPEGTIYVKNDCYLDKSRPEVLPFTCSYSKELSEIAAKRYAELTRGATTNIIVKRVLITLAIFIAFAAISLVPGGLAAYGFAATASKLAAVLTFVGTVGTLATGPASVFFVYEHSKALKECTNKECKINEGMNIAETLLDVLDFATLAVLPQALGPDSDLSTRINKAKAVASPTSRGISKLDAEVVHTAINISAFEQADLGYGPVIRQEGEWGTTYKAQQELIVNFLANKEFDPNLKNKGFNQKDFDHNNLSLENVSSFISKMIRAPFENLGEYDLGAGLVSDGVCSGAVSEWLKRLKMGKNHKESRNFLAQDVAYLMETDIGHLDAEAWGGHIGTNNIAWDGYERSTQLQRDSESKEWKVLDPWLEDLKDDPGVFAAIVFTQKTGGQHVVGLTYLDGEFRYFDPNHGWVNSSDTDIIKAVWNESLEDGIDLASIYYGSLKDNPISVNHYNSDGSINTNSDAVELPQDW